jgi:hypothetical protein
MFKTLTSVCCGFIHQKLKMIQIQTIALNF